jgi:NADH-quinone oxidoreductase subunit I
MDTGLHAVPYDSRDQFLYDRDLMLSFEARAGGHETTNPRHEPGDPTFPGLTREHAEH